MSHHIIKNRKDRTWELRTALWMEHVHFRWSPDVTECLLSPVPHAGAGLSMITSLQGQIGLHKSLASDADFTDDLMKQWDRGWPRKAQNRTKVRYPWVISVWSLSLSLVATCLISNSLFPMLLPPFPNSQKSRCRHQKANLLLYNKNLQPREQNSRNL